MNCVRCSLPNALKATKPEDDLCNSMGFVCSMKGLLEKIDFSNAGVCVCGGGAGTAGRRYST
jgi:hypothetical protein